MTAHRPQTPWAFLSPTTIFCSATGSGPLVLTMADACLGREAGVPRGDVSRQ